MALIARHCRLAFSAEQRAVVPEGAEVVAVYDAGVPLARAHRRLMTVGRVWAHDERPKPGEWGVSQGELQLGGAPLGPVTVDLRVDDPLLAARLPRHKFREAELAGCVGPKRRQALRAGGFLD